MTDRLAVFGIRHHSPACAHRVGRLIEELRPAFVLVEGPADFNPHIGELRLGHALPVAIFSYHAAPGRSFASYAPFCAYSPEWAALQAAWRVGAAPLFCDLPAWHQDFGDRTNRYADPHSGRAAAAEAALGRAMGEDGLDSLWDALAEQAPAEELDERLDRYFDLLRPDGEDDPREGMRERFMAAHAAWALREAGGRPVVLVCGGWHAGAIRRLAREADGVRPEMPVPAAGEQAGSYLVPYDYHRLDRFTGYASGMPSPGYYERVHADGLALAADWAMNAIAAGLRAAGQVVSTADRVVWRVHAEALAMARGHRAVLRADLLDSALAILVKEGLDAPAAWTQAGAVRPGTHPAIVVMLRALTGEGRGHLTAGTRQPPLVADVEARLTEAGLTLLPVARQVALDWNESAGRQQAHILNALMLLGIPGVERVQGEEQAQTRAPREIFRLVLHRDGMGMLIEASRWGATLPMAAAARLSERAEQAGDDPAALSACLSLALFAGLLGRDGDLTARIAAGLAHAHDIGPIGTAGLRLVRLYRFGAVFGDTAHAGLGRLCEAVFACILWLIEGIRNAEEGLRAIDAMIAVRDILRDCPALAIDGDSFLAAAGRCAIDRDGAPALAGAALGLLIACRAAGATDAAGHLRHFSRPDQLGDFLAGLFALSREEIAGDQGILDAVSRLVDGWADDAFLEALPALRQAFAYFPPRERERLARSILRAHGRGEAQAEGEALAWMRQRVGVTDQAAALALEAMAARRLAAAGLL